MLSPTTISNYQTQSLANARDAAMLTFDTLHRLGGLSLHALQASADTSLRRAMAPAGSAGDHSMAEELRGLFHESLHLTSGWLIDLVKVAEAQWGISHRCAHAAVHELHKWAPRELETTVSALDLALDAAESATENLADAGVMVVKRLEDESELLCARPVEAGTRKRATAAPRAVRSMRGDNS